MESNTIEEKFASLEEIIKELGKEDIGIEEALELYAKGKVYVEECKSKIDTIEKEVLKVDPNGELSSFNEADF